MPTPSRITPCLWFDDQGEDAANFYTGIFRNSSIGTINRYTEAGHEVHGRPAGSVMVVAFELDGQPFTALNGGPHFKFNEAISLRFSASGRCRFTHCCSNSSTTRSTTAARASCTFAHSGSSRLRFTTARDRAAGLSASALPRIARSRRPPRLSRFQCCSSAVRA